MSFNLNLSGPATSMIRIAAAALAGTVVRILANKYAIDIDGETLAAATTAVAIGAWYAVAKVVETKWPRVRLLGLADPDNDN